jgi:transcription antitermination factor NusG
MIIDSVDINPTSVGHAVEIKDSSGTIVGTLVYFDYVTHAQLTTPVEEGVAADEEVGVDEDPYADLDGDEAEVTEDAVDDGVLSDTPVTVDEFNRESKLIDLELALAEAVHAVQDIEDQIADIEKEEAID